MIKLLDKDTINKIAAGEVVDRPASVVKELVENSIDAGAKNIVVEIKNGGIDMIRVTDDGCGIPTNEVSQAFIRHATSKLENADQLSGIRTLGFRGEALASISAVARVELITKTKDDLLGTQCVKSSDTFEVSEVASADGTTVFVYDLFKDVPARRKFLKSANSEANAIITLIDNLCISNPDVSFNFINNGKSRVHTSGNDRLLDVIYEIYGKDFTKGLIDISFSFNNLSIYGFIGKPEFVRKNRSLEHFYVNGRFIKSKLLSNAIENAYGGYIMGGTFPVCVLFIDSYDGSIDVNVHPTKQEVRFNDEALISELIYDEVSAKLHAIEDIPVVSVPSAPEVEYKKNTLHESEVKPEARNTSILDVKYESSVTSEPELHTVYQKSTPRPISIPEPFERTIIEEIKSSAPESIVKEPEYVMRDEQLSFISEEAKKKREVIGQVFDTYWIVQLGDDMYIIDQHAAHEKVLYERIASKVREHDVLSQNLLVNEMLILSNTQMELVRENTSLFEQLGFILMDDGREISLSAIPAHLPRVSPLELFMEVLSEVEDDNHRSTPEVLVDKMATMACKAAVKGNNKMTFKEVEDLLDEMLTLDNPYHCPHGRPTMITMSKYEMEKRFKRIV